MNNLLLIKRLEETRELFTYANVHNQLIDSWVTSEGSPLLSSPLLSILFLPRPIPIIKPGSLFMFTCRGFGFKITQFTYQHRAIAFDQR